MSKNVLYICPTSHIGGAETFIKSTWLGHNKDHFSPQYLLFSDGPLAKWLGDHKAPYDILLEKPRLSQPQTWLKTHFAIRKFIKARNIHLVHSTMAYAALFSSFAALGTPHVWFQHGPAAGWMDRIAAIFPHRLLLTNSQMTTQKQLMLESIVSYLIPKSRLIKQIDLGIGEPRFSPRDVDEFRTHLLTSHNLPPSTCLIGMACRMQKWKGVHHTLKAASLLTHSITKENSPFYFFIWGDCFDDQGYFDYLKEWANHLPVKFLGQIEDARFALATCEIVVNASIQPEPFGLTLIEGMSSGAVPVAPSWGGPAEIIQNNNNGLLFEPLNPEDLEKQLKLLIENKSLREKLKVNAQKTYIEKYTLSQMMDKLESLYQEILN